MTTVNSSVRDELAAGLYDVLASTVLEPLSTDDEIPGLPGRWFPRPDGGPGARVELAEYEHLLLDGVERTGPLDLDMSDPRTPHSDAVALDAHPRVRSIRIFADPAGVDVLDLTTAVVPTCAFNPLVNCPLPPRSNWIRSVVRAGRRDVLSAAAPTDGRPVERTDA